MVLSRFFALNSFKRDGVFVRELAKEIRVSFIPGTHGRMIIIVCLFTIKELHRA